MAPAVILTMQGATAAKFASLWVDTRVVKDWLFYGFPWLFVGYAYTAQPWLTSLAPILGCWR